MSKLVSTNTNNNNHNNNPIPYVSNFDCQSSDNLLYETCVTILASPVKLMFFPLILAFDFVVCMPAYLGPSNKNIHSTGYDISKETLTTINI